MIRAGLQALLSHWRRNPLQLFTLVAGLALATALWSGVQAVNSEARASYDAAAATLGEGRYDQLLPRAGTSLPESRFIDLRRAGWQVGPVLEGELENGLRIIGLDPLTAPGGMGPVTATDDLSLPEILAGGLVFATPKTADRLPPDPGYRVITDPAVAPGTALTDIATAQDLLNEPGRITRLIVSDSQPLNRPPLAEIAPDLIRQPAQAGSDLSRLTDSFHLNLTAFGLLGFAVGIFIVHGATGLAFEQRRGMIRTLRALGMPLTTLIALTVTELLIIALVAGLTGTALGWLVAAGLLPDVSATLEGLYGARIAQGLSLRPEWWLSGLAIAIGGTAIAASGALYGIARMPILAGSRARTAMTTRGLRGLAIASAILLAAALLLALFGTGLAAGFALLGCMLIGAALALPLILRAVLTLAESRAPTALRQWFWADTRAQLSGLSLALMALLLAMAANVGVSTMVSSFRATFTGFLDQRLAADLYIVAEDGDALEAFLAPRDVLIRPVMDTDTRLAGLPAELGGARVSPIYTDNWEFLSETPDLWTRVETGEAVIINEQLSRRAGLAPGDTLAITPDLTLPIAGVFGDYGNPVGQAIIGEDLFRQLHPDIQPTRFGLGTEDPAALREALVNEFGLAPAAITNQAGVKALSMSIFERTFTVTGALNVLTLAVAGFAILMSLLTLATMRLPHLAPVWALGLTRRQLGRLELARAVILAALTALCALPLGLALAWVLLAIINVEAFGWKLPMFLFPLDYARLGLLALAAAALAALWPAIRLSRTPPADLLKVFANER